MHFSASRPVKLRWSFEDNGAIKVTTVRATEAKVWVATNPEARDFRWRRSACVQDTKRGTEGRDRRQSRKPDKGYSVLHQLTMRAAEISVQVLDAGGDRIRCRLRLLSSTRLRIERVEKTSA
jgi:hypothetical protein